MQSSQENHHFDLELKGLTLEKTKINSLFVRSKLTVIQAPFYVKRHLLEHKKVLT